MKVGANVGEDFNRIIEKARRFEDLGLDTITTAELGHDPFLPLMLAAEHTRRVEMMTSIAVAFARNPMNLANLGHDLNAYSKGRFTLGLGSQIRAHINWRYSMPWSSPAARMRELVLALHAIWDTWLEGKPLEFRGDFYSHTLMTPRFTPTDTQYGRPKVTVAAVGPLMTRTAAEVADGMICHAFTTERYFREVTLPMLEKTLAGRARKRSDFQVIWSPFVAFAATPAEADAARKALRQQIAFYASTPAYRVVLEQHGWGDLQSRLHPMSKAGQWMEMGDLIDEEVFDAFAIVGDPEAIADQIVRRYEGLVDRVQIHIDGLKDEEARAFVTRLRSASAAARAKA
jgi:probable F420-dependent oxidoreductase